MGNMMFNEGIESWESLMFLYKSALKEVTTKLEILNDELSVKNERNPIEFITSRVKSPNSIVGKLQRKELPISLTSVTDNINDVAGIRIICPFKTDIPKIKNVRQNRKIERIKSNGKRSRSL